MRVSDYGLVVMADWNRERMAQYGYCPKHPSVRRKAGVRGEGNTTKTFIYCPECVSSDY